jgi:large subunit ribosomal protein L17
MRHLVSGRKLKRTSSHRKALLANLATELFRHKSIKTTEAKAKELRPYAESLITKAKNALLKEKQGLLPEGHTIDVHSRRIVARHIRVKEVLSELFDSIAPAVVERNGGYARIIKTGIRQGDAGRTAIIELVDFSAPQDGLAGLKKKKKKNPAKPKVEGEKSTPINKVEAVAAETVNEVKSPEIIESVETAEVSNTIIEDVVESTETVVEETKEEIIDETAGSSEEENKG